MTRPPYLGVAEDLVGVNNQQVQGEPAVPFHPGGAMDDNEPDDSGFDCQAVRGLVNQFRRDARTAVAILARREAQLHEVEADVAAIKAEIEADDVEVEAPA